MILYETAVIFSFFLSHLQDSEKYRFFLCFLPSLLVFLGEENKLTISMHDFDADIGRC